MLVYSEFVAKWSIGNKYRKFPLIDLPLQWGYLFLERDVINIKMGLGNFFFFLGGEGTQIDKFFSQIKKAVLMISFFILFCPNDHNLFLFFFILNLSFLFFIFSIIDLFLVVFFFCFFFICYFISFVYLFFKRNSEWT